MQIPKTHDDRHRQERNALQLARLLLLAVYQETTPRASNLRHTAVELVDSCRRGRRTNRVPRAEEGLDRLRQELDLAQQSGRIDDAAASRLSRLVAQARCRPRMPGDRLPVDRP
ncbi:MAG: hypothetical protein AAGK22_12280 [Acidobacteriota bacterium]